MQRHIDQLRLCIDDDADEVEINVNPEVNNMPVINNPVQPVQRDDEPTPEVHENKCRKSHCAADDDAQPATSWKTLPEEPAENTLRRSNRIPVQTKFYGVSDGSN